MPYEPFQYFCLKIFLISSKRAFLKMEDNKSKLVSITNLLVKKTSKAIELFSVSVLLLIFKVREDIEADNGQFPSINMLYPSRLI